MIPVGAYMTETHARSIIKAVSYRFLGSMATALIFYVLSGNAKLSAGAGVTDMVVKIGLYFLHERLWDRISFGRKPEPSPEYEI